MLLLETTRQIITEKFPSLEMMQQPICDALYWKVCFALHATLHLFVLWQMFLLQTSFFGTSAKGSFSSVADDASSRQALS